MKTIFKYTLPTGPEIIGGMPGVEFQLPTGAEVIKIAEQDDSYKMWVLVDKDAELKKHLVIFVPTGVELDDDIVDWHYLDTIFITGFVYHIFWKEYNEIQ